MLRKKNTGFTIVELLIVIVVIAILAAISVVAYQGVQGRANDSVRRQDIASIRKALELYKADHGRYPDPAPNPGINSWEASVNPGFLGSLSDYSSVIPLDPANTTSKYYAYYRDSAGAYGCPASAGAFYVLRITQLDTVDGRDISDLGPCTGSSSLSASRTPTRTQAVFMGFENN